MNKNKALTLLSEIRKEANNLNIRKVLTGLSGGADSIATTFLLHKAGLEVIALHCNFNLRGEESERDQRFVETFCHNNNIPLKRQSFDVEKYRREHPGTSIEMACRDLRYRWFFKELEEIGFDRIAIGHNADDNIETFFLNLLRGAGSRGLKGMQQDNGKIWRPLLKIHRKEIINYINENNLEFIVDSSNLGNDYRRNFLRNTIFPLLKSEWSGFETSLDTSLRNIYEENRIVEKALEDIISKNKDALDVKEIVGFGSPLLLIKRFIEDLGPYPATPKEILNAINAEKPHIPRWNIRFGSVFIKKGKLRKVYKEPIR